MDIHHHRNWFVTALSSCWVDLSALLGFPNLLRDTHPESSMLSVCKIYMGPTIFTSTLSLSKPLPYTPSLYRRGGCTNSKRVQPHLLRVSSRLLCNLVQGLQRSVVPSNLTCPPSHQTPHTFILSRMTSKQDSEHFSSLSSFIITTVRDGSA